MNDILRRVEALAAQTAANAKHVEEMLAHLFRPKSPRLEEPLDAADEYEVQRYVDSTMSPERMALNTQSALTEIKEYETMLNEDKVKARRREAALKLVRARAKKDRLLGCK